ADTDKAKVEQLRDLSSYYKIDMVRLIAASKADTEEMSAIQGKRLNKEAPNSSKTTAEDPSPKEIEEPKFSDDEFFRCMYAGFILKSGPGRAPASLQEDLKEVPNLKCSSPQVLCNPLLFGAKTDCSPEVLVSARKDASV